MVTNEMLAEAMRKAVEVGLLPAWADTETYLKHWEQLRAVLEAAQQKMHPTELSRVKKSDSLVIGG